MKKIIAGLLLTVSSLTFNQANATDMECSVSRELAEQTMRFRQAGGSRAELDAVVYSATGQAIADMAWARGVVPQSVRKTAVKAFADHVEQLCSKIKKESESQVAELRT